VTTEDERSTVPEGAEGTDFPAIHAIPVEEPENLPPENDDNATRLTAAQDARNTKLRRAGRFAGQGYPIQWIADRFGEQVGTVRKWQNDHAFLEGYAAAEGATARDAALALSKIALSLPQLVDTSISVALDTGHKDSSVERRFLIDKVLIPMTVQHTQHGVADPRALDAIASALRGVAALAPAQVPQLLDGKDAAAQYGAQIGDSRAAAVDAEVVSSEPKT
jgi:hypothetical protein